MLTACGGGGSDSDSGGSSGGDGDDGGLSSDTDDFTANTSTTAAINLDTVVQEHNAEIEVGDDKDWHKITITETGNYAFSLEGDSSSFDGEIIGLYDGSGNLVTTTSLINNGAGESDTARYSDLGVGTYYFAVSGENNTTGSYKITGMTILAEIDNENAGETLSGSIDTALGLAAYDINAEAGEDITVTLTPDNTFNGFIYLYDTAGNIISASSGNGAGGVETFTYTSTSAAEYGLFVFSEDGTTGSYDLVVNVGNSGGNDDSGFSSDSDDFTANSATTADLTLDQLPQWVELLGGTINSATIEVAGDEDWHKVIIDETGDYGFTPYAANEDSTLTAEIVGLYDEAGNLVTADIEYDISNGEIASNIFYDLNAGTYYLAVTGYHDTIGDYEVMAAEILETIDNTNDGATLSGSINEIPELDGYYINAAAGETVTITVESDTGFSPYIQLQDKYGDAVGEANGDGTLTVTHESAETANYGFLIISQDGTTGAYDLTIDIV